MKYAIHWIWRSKTILVSGSRMPEKNSFNAPILGVDAAKDKQKVHLLCLNDLRLIVSPRSESNSQRPCL